MPRSARLACTLGILLLASAACGDDDGTGPSAPSGTIAWLRARGDSAELVTITGTTERAYGVGIRDVAAMWWTSAGRLRLQALGNQGAGLYELGPTGGLALLARDPILSIMEPSHDGLRVARPEYTSFGDQERWQLQVLSRGLAEPRVVWEATGDVGSLDMPACLAWMPRDSALSWVSRDSLFVQPLAGGTRRFLRTLPLLGAQCAWSPDGNRLAIVQRVGSSLWIVNAAPGGAVHGDDSHRYSWPRWSRDGSRLVAGFFDFDGEARSSGLAFMSVDGQLRAVPLDAVPPVATPWSAYDWLPGDSAVALIGGTSAGGYGLHSLHATSGAPVALSGSRGTGDPQWVMQGAVAVRR